MTVAEERAAGGATLRWAGPRPFSAAGASGVVGGGLLLALYLGIVTLAQGADHALAQLREDLWFIAPVTAGFGTQMALFVRLRRLHARPPGGAAAAAGSGGVGAGAMLACCAHHLSDILPVVGVSGAAMFLSEFKTPLALLGLAVTAAGVAYLSWRLRSVQRLACH